MGALGHGSGVANQGFKVQVVQVPRHSAGQLSFKSFNPLKTMKKKTYFVAVLMLHDAPHALEPWLTCCKAAILCNTIPLTIS